MSRPWVLIHMSEGMLTNWDGSMDFELLTIDWDDVREGGFDGLEYRLDDIAKWPIAAQGSVLCDLIDVVKDQSWRWESDPLRLQELLARARIMLRAINAEPSDEHKAWDELFRATTVSHQYYLDNL